MPPGGKGTRTGAVLELMIQTALEQNYPGEYAAQQTIGTQLFGGTYRADYMVHNDTIVSLKWQQVSGTAEQKLLYEIASLVQLIRNSVGKHKKGYVVLGGHGFSSSAREFLLKQRHCKVVADGELVEVVSLEDFIARLNMRTI